MDSPLSSNPRMLLTQQHFPMQKIPLSNGLVRSSQLLQLLDYVLLSQQDLRTGLHAWAEGFVLLNSQYGIQLQQDETHLRLVLKSTDSLPNWLYYLWLLLLERIGEFIAGNKMPSKSPLSALVSASMHCTSQQRTNYPQSALFRTINFEDKQTVINLANGILNSKYKLPLPNVGAGLTDVLSLLKFGNINLGNSESAKLKFLLNHLLPAVPDIEEAASELNTSKRSLQRQLKQQGLTYSQLVNEVRYSRALTLLAQQQTPMQEIANKLGFIEQSSFNHAFKKWYGQSPSQYKKQFDRLNLSHQEIKKRAPVSLYYSENHMQYQSNFQRKGYQVWIAVLNLHPDKYVSVRFEYPDGIWREFRATYHRFLSDGVELWGTSNLIPASNLNFEIIYHTAGERYCDNNQGQGYRHEVSESYLLGGHPMVLVSHFIMPTSASEYLVRLSILSSKNTHNSKQDRLVISELNSSDDKHLPLTLAKPTESLGNCLLWSISLYSNIEAPNYSINYLQVSADGTEQSASLINIPLVRV